MDSEPRASDNGSPVTPVKVNDQGISVLYEPSSHPILVDVPFVHGLQGHPKGTWSTKTAAKDGKGKSKPGRSRLSRIFRKAGSVQDEDEEPSVCWPAELLPSDHSNVRILTYGYESRVSRFFQGPANKDNISQHGRALLNATVRSRRSCLSRPLVFVAHSLGGIIVKEALIESRKQGAHDSTYDISRHCPAIIFFGTPHRGLSAAAWGSMLSSMARAAMFNTNSTILADLDPSSGSSKLEDIERDFNDFLKSMKIYTFQESTGVSGFGPASNKVVLSQSSAFNNREFELLETIDANHMNMCRFYGESDDGYQKLDGALTSIVERIDLANQSRDIQNEAEQGASQRLRQERAERQREGLSVPKPPLSLNYAERLARERHINPATSSTVKWLWDITSSSGSSFTDWLSNDQLMFWISGKPGSGKSTLMAELYCNDQVLKILDGFTSKSWVIIRFFFDFRAGKGMANNLEGFFRSLTFQLVDKGSKSSSLLRNDAEAAPSDLEAGKRVGECWNLKELQEMLLGKFNEQSRNILLFVDGIDEYEGDKLVLLQFLQSLDAVKRESSLLVKIFLASRPEPLVHQVLKDNPGLRMEDHNFKGIESYASTVIQSLAPSSSDVNWLTRASRSITNRSEGVFLWAAFAIKELVKSFVEGEDLEALEAALEALPSGLGHLYDQIFDRMDAEKKEVAVTMLLLVSHARRALQVEELIMATEIAMGRRPKYTQLLDSEARVPLQKQIIAKSGGLLEAVLNEPVKSRAERNWVVAERQLATDGWVDPNAHTVSEQPSHNSLTSSEDMVVKVIHQTVRAYMDRSRLFQKGDEEDLNRSCPPGIWLIICTRSLVDIVGRHDAFHEARARATRGLPGIQELTKKFWLARYAATSVFFHAQELETDWGISSYPLLKSCINPALTYLHDSCDFCDSGLSRGADRNPWTLPILHGLLKFCQDAISNNDCNFPVDHIATYYAVDDSAAESWERNRLSGFPEELLNRLIQGGATIDHDCIVYGLRKCSDNVLEDIIRSAPPPAIWWEFEPIKMCRPLYFLVHERNRAGFCLHQKLNLLLGLGEQINSVCGPDRTALHTVINGELWGFSVPLIEALLNAGADANANGPHGTPLSLAWKRAQSGDLRSRCCRTLRRLIDILLSKDAKLVLSADTENKKTLKEIRKWTYSQVPSPLTQDDGSCDTPKSRNTQKPAPATYYVDRKPTSLDTWGESTFRIGELESSTPWSTKLSYNYFDVSRCFGEHDPHAIVHLQDEGCDQVVEHVFKDGCVVLIVKLYVRKRDRCAKVLCVSSRSEGRNKLSCATLTSLSWDRRGGLVFLNRKNKYDPECLEPWAKLHFNDMETMIVFYYTLWTLLGYDTTTWSGNENFYFSEIKLHFGSTVTFNGVEHILRVFLDIDVSFGWLESTIWTSDNRNTPIWISFFQPRDKFNNWHIEAQDGPFVKLCNIRRHFFVDTYFGIRPDEVGDVLEFETVSDAEGFILAIEELLSL